MFQYITAVFLFAKIQSESQLYVIIYYLTFSMEKVKKCYSFQWEIVNKAGGT